MDWNGATIDAAVDITMQTTLRHTMTRDDTLLSEGVDREVARQTVQPKVSAMIAAWRKRRT